MKNLFRTIKELFQPEEGSKEQTTEKVNLGTSNSQDFHKIVRKNYVAFDLEISKVVQGDFSAWKMYRPLGISCAALSFNDQEPILWYSKTPDGTPASRMSKGKAIELVDYLVDCVEKGWEIITWNGLGFDFDVLAEESDCWDQCRDLALNHIDMMFHIFCLQGYPLGMDKVAKGMGLSGKTKGMSGDLAPVLWEQGKYQTVMEYVSQDVRTTYEVAMAVLHRKQISWTSSSGKFQTVSLPNGWLPVKSALMLSFPDTSWMNHPLQRNEFYEWTQADHRYMPIVQKPIAPPTQSVEKPRKEPQTVAAQPFAGLPRNEINRIFETFDIEDNPSLGCKADLYSEYSEYDYDYYEDDLLNENHLDRFFDGCPCPICMGEPGNDIFFQRLFEPQYQDYSCDDVYW